MEELVNKSGKEQKFGHTFKPSKTLPSEKNGLHRRKARRHYDMQLLDKMDKEYSTQVIMVKNEADEARTLYPPSNQDDDEDDQGQPTCRAVKKPGVIRRPQAKSQHPIGSNRPGPDGVKMYAAKILKKSGQDATEENSNALI